MEKLIKLQKLCKADIRIEINTHRGVYEGVKEHIYQEELEEIEKSVLNKMIETDTLIRIQFYPNTPTSFITVFHYDLEKALDESLKIIKKVKWQT